MEKELIRLYEAVKKAADAATTSTAGEVEENRCLDAFKLLKKFPVNYQILASTQVGKHLRVLTKHPKKKIRVFAMDLVDIWKAKITKEISKSKEEKVYQKVSEAEKTKRNRTSSSQNGKTKAVVDVAKAEKTDRNIETSTSENVKEKDCNVVTGEKTVSVANMAKDEKKQVSGILNEAPSSLAAPSKKETMIKTNDERRDKIREILHEAFPRVSGEADEAIKDQVKTCDPVRVSVAVESVLFQNWGHFNGAQKIKYRSLMFNLKDPKNPDFRRRVLLGEYSPERLVDMKTAEMASDKRKKENETIKRKALFDCERGQKPKATTDQFKCGKCGKRESIFHQMQTRSADEPMTTYVTCVSCNHHWKFC
ncbi:transcription elongation factor TFIIS-like [Neltuma alba]|uniref:transcription elongation factor TFIIS-like n=1 Tax=Neltuma alba TaxID=207710 RepID=UPI0010A49AA7|nr:transcription elongation factor TFIIS-like [Prosopis alba]